MHPRVFRIADFSQCHQVINRPGVRCAGVGNHHHRLETCRAIRVDHFLQCFGVDRLIFVDLHCSQIGFRESGHERRFVDAMMCLVGSVDATESKIIAQRFDSSSDHGTQIGNRSAGCQESTAVGRVADHVAEPANDGRFNLRHRRCSLPDRRVPIGQARNQISDSRFR